VSLDCIGAKYKGLVIHIRSILIKCDTIVGGGPTNCYRNFFVSKMSRLIDED